MVFVWYWQQSFILGLKVKYTFSELDFCKFIDLSWKFYPTKTKTYRIPKESCLYPQCLLFSRGFIQVVWTLRSQGAGICARASVIFTSQWTTKEDGFIAKYRFFCRMIFLTSFPGLFAPLLKTESPGNEVVIFRLKFYFSYSSWFKKITIFV